MSEATTTPTPQSAENPMTDRGWVYVGRVRTSVDFCVIDKAQNIRRWGTSRGLGELVSGPRPDTQLDPTGTVKSPLRAVISIIAVDEASWEL